MIDFRTGARTAIYKQAQVLSGSSTNEPFLITPARSAGTVEPG